MQAPLPEATSAIPASTSEGQVRVEAFTFEAANTVALQQQVQSARLGGGEEKDKLSKSARSSTASTSSSASCDMCPEPKTTGSSKCKTHKRALQNLQKQALRKNRDGTYTDEAQVP